MTHRQSGDLWLCHSCSCDCYWHSATGMPGDDIPRDPYATENGLGVKRITSVFSWKCFSMLAVLPLAREDYHLGDACWLL